MKDGAGGVGTVQAQLAGLDGLRQVWGPTNAPLSSRRLLGLFAHPDDEVFCVAGTIARCAQQGASTTIVSLTRGEAGQIRDYTAATRRTLGAIRSGELGRAAQALGVDRSECLDLGDGTLAHRPLDEVTAEVLAVLEQFSPDVVVTFGPDGAYGHPDHVISCLATLAAVRALPDPPRLLHARFPMRKQLLLDLLVDWLTSREGRFAGTAAFAHALKLFADGSSMLGFAADHLRVEWFPAGAFIIEQGEAATELFCLLSGSVDIVVESDDGRMSRRDSAGAGSFVGQDGLATGRTRNAHVVAREDVTCLVLAPGARNTSVARGAREAGPAPVPREVIEALPDPGSFSLDVADTVERKIAALAAHRSQYALDLDLLPRRMLTSLLGTEHFAVVDPWGG